MFWQVRVLARAHGKLLGGLSLSATGIASFGASAFHFYAAATAAMCEDESSVPKVSRPKVEKPALKYEENRAFRLDEVEQLTPSTRKLTFALDSPTQCMGVPVGSCLIARAKVNGRRCMGYYYPVNHNDESGILQLLVKDNANVELAKYMSNMQPGESLELKGPLPRISYRPNRYEKIGLIAEGYGIAPMLQLIKQICRDPCDRTEIVLLYQNSSEDEIALRDELDAIEYLYKGQFQVFYSLEDAPDDWEGYRGQITKEVIEELMPEPSDSNLVCVAGPSSMKYYVSGDRAKDLSQGELQGLLKKSGYTSKQVLKF